jgi:hypothetical protein
MITKDELEALLQILARTPVTMAESLWLTELIRRWQEEVPPDQAAEIPELGKQET